MKRIILGLVVIVVFAGLVFPGPFKYSGAVGRWASHADGIQFVAEQDTANVGIVHIENTGTGDGSNLELISLIDGNPGIVFAQSTTNKATMQYDDATDHLEFHHLTASNPTVKIDSSGNLLIHSNTTGAQQLLIFARGAIRFDNFITELSAGAGSSVIRSTDGFTGTSELYAENEAGEVNQLTGDASFQAVLSSSGPFTLFSVSSTTLTSTTPLAQGEMYFNTGANKLFISTGTGIGDWAASDAYTVGP